MCRNVFFAMLYHNVVSQCCITMLCHNAVSQCCITMLCHNAVSQCCVTMLYHNVVSQYCITMLCHNAVSQCCVTILYHNVVSQRSVSGSNTIYKHICLLHIRCAICISSNVHSIRYVATIDCVAGCDTIYICLCLLRIFCAGFQFVVHLMCWLQCPTLTHTLFHFADILAECGGVVFHFGLYLGEGVTVALAVETVELGFEFGTVVHVVEMGEFVEDDGLT